MAGMKESGGRLDEAVRRAMPRVGIANITHLCDRAHIQRTTYYQWVNGATVPSPPALERLASALQVSPADLWAAYEGRDLQPPTLEAALREQAEAMERLASRIDQLVRRLNGLASSAIADQVRRTLDEDEPDPRPRVTKGREAREAEAALVAEPEVQRALAEARAKRRRGRAAASTGSAENGPAGL